MSSKNQERITAPALSEAEIKKHWPDGQPEAIIFASASLRKGLLLHLWLQMLEGKSQIQFSTPDFVGAVNLDFSSPLAFQKSVEDQIRNGDGTAKQSVVIGYFFGVPIILDPQDGETRSHDALAESRNKINSVSEKYAGRNVVIFACDTVGEVEAAFGEWKRFGKPRNEPGFHEDVERLGQEVWKLFYLWDHYWRSDGLSVPLKHQNALLMRGAKNGQSTETVHNTTLELQVPHDFESVFRNLNVFLESGGGGVFQQLIDWTISILDKISDDEMRSVLAQMPEEQRPWHLMLNIMGMQAWQLLSALRASTGLQYTDTEIESVIA
ncbi:MAG: hypothetical protein GW946_03760 [Candidatus Pacebacteria bacterium]|nr:hypothetical protein [Candidatus Paceibacterota bacterium]PIR60428.1 MAG: hypothetical protein COU67_02240 [Candidatus Pacebacteria bacterium CG10_big_fil_rev_8_21_14_0_10_44_54]